MLVSCRRNAYLENKASCRLRETLVFFEMCRLVYVIHQLWDKHLPDFDFFVFYVFLFLKYRGVHKRVFRLRENVFFQALHSCMLVSCGLNAHFQNPLSSRLRDTLAFCVKVCLVYARHLLLEAALAKANQTEPNQADRKSRQPFFCCVSSTRNACLRSGFKI